MPIDAQTQPAAAPAVQVPRRLWSDPGTATAARWYVVQTQPHAEARAVSNLERQDYRVFCPRMRKTMRHARKARQVLLPLFPGYVFLQRDISTEAWRSVNGTHGVVRLICNGEIPQAIPCGVVEALLSGSDDDGALNWTPPLKLGQTVRIVDGPFTDLCGVLEKLDASGRVRVLLDLMGRSVSVALRYEALTPAA